MCKICINHKTRSNYRKDTNKTVKDIADPGVLGRMRSRDKRKEKAAGGELIKSPE